MNDKLKFNKLEKILVVNTSIDSASSKFSYDKWAVLFFPV